MKNTKYIVLLICFFILVLFTSALASDGTTISCNIAHPPDYEYVGEIEVFNLAAAASACNNFYATCQGACVGCYLNSESIEICIDKNGNQFVKE